MISIDGCQEAGLLIKRELRTQAGIGVIGEVEVTRVADGVGLHPGQEPSSCDLVANTSRSGIMVPWKTP